MHFQKMRELVAMTIASHMLLNANDHDEFWTLDDIESISVTAIEDDLRDMYKMGEFESYALILGLNFADESEANEFDEFIYNDDTIANRIVYYMHQLISNTQFTCFKG